MPFLVANPYSRSKMLISASIEIGDGVPLNKSLGDEGIIRSPFKEDVPFIAAAMKAGMNFSIALSINGIGFSFGSHKRRKPGKSSVVYLV
jgi:hypothetical protein